MKKRILNVTMILTAAILLGACGNKDVTITSSVQEEVKEEMVAEEPVTASVTSVEEESEAPLESVPQNGDVDIDLTKLSKTMVYSEVYNIMMNPDDYVGKTVRMSGGYNVFTDDTSGNTYFYCVIQDATACCAQGIEFVLTEDYKFPEDYPEEGTKVTVVGRFDTYMEGEYLYCTLRDAVLEN